MRRALAWRGGSKKAGWASTRLCVQRCA
jgi:hypothetical protein